MGKVEDDGWVSWNVYRAKSATTRVIAGSELASRSVVMNGEIQIHNEVNLPYQ